MRTRWLTVFLALGLGLFLAANPAQAQSCGGIEQPECPPEDDNIGDKKDNGPGGEAINSGITREIVKIIAGANETCDDERIELRYRIDCLRIYYLKVADRLPDRGDYRPIKQAMLDAAAKLDAIVLANLDETAPAIRPREGHKPLAKRLPPVRAVKKSAEQAAAAQAAAVVEETELIIIRSGGDPARRTQAYTDVAAAVEENLVILRSA